MSLIGRRVVFAKGNDRLEGQIVDKLMGDFLCIEANNGDAHFAFYSDLVSFVNKKEKPKTVRIMANSLCDLDVDFDYDLVKYIPIVGFELYAEVVYDSLPDDCGIMLLVTKVEHKADGLVCVYVEPLNDLP